MKKDIGFVYITKNEYVERCRKIVDHRIESNYSPNSKSNIPRPRIFLYHEINDGIYKIYSLTSAKSNSKYLSGRFDRISNLPKQCLFSLEKDGCILLNNPFFVPINYLQKIDINTPPIGEENRYKRYKRQISYLENNFINFEKALNLLWCKDTTDESILAAQRYCINMFLAWTYAVNEKKYLDKNSKNILMQSKLTQIYDDMDKINGLELKTLEEIKVAQLKINSAIIALAKENNISFDLNNYDYNILLNIIEKYLFESKKESKKLKSKQGIQ